MLKVMQCWDDGVVNDIRLTELLRKYGAKATFNLNPGFHSDARTLDSWTPAGYVGWSCKGFMPGKVGKNEMLDVYAGFQVASHCMKHEGATGVPLETFVKSAVDARRFLEDLFQRDCRGFAWPCGVFTQETADALLAEGFAYGRTVKDSPRVSDCVHPMILNPSCHFQNGQFYKLYEDAKKGDGLFYFWGHSYEMLDSEGLWRQLEDKLKFISEDKDAVWVDVVDIDWSRGKR